jgi:hypothetical protein
VSAIRARHLIVIIFSLGRSLRFAQNNCGFVEKLSQPLLKNGFEAEVLPAREHRSGDLCGAQAMKPVFRRGSAAVAGGRHRSLQILCRLVTCFSTEPTSLPARRTAADTACESKVWSRYMNISAKRVTLTLPEIGLIAMTRGAFGVGIGLLLSNALEKEERRSAGLALLAVGVLTTVPILMRLRNELK